MWLTNGAKNEAYEELTKLANTIADYMPNGAVELQFDPAKYRVQDSGGFVTIRLQDIQAFGNDIKDILAKMINLAENFIIKPINANTVEIIFGIFGIHTWNPNEHVELTDEEKAEFGLTDEEMNVPLDKFSGK